ncbi:anti-sigma factor family protein [Salipaludibacillus sp. HK11]|uniref:anti-sigma factor family protein n=1 Tax=Salipaludibacillus sp. HK11 TaxID=3394320 RepID=UPI0039FD1AD6
MNHQTKEDWLDYVNDELPWETRAVYEEHLYTCEKCMETYLHVIEESSHLLPDVENEESFVEGVLSQIEVPIYFKTTKPGKTKRVFYKQTAFHYVLAASLTVLFMSSGVFQSITTYVDEVQKTTISEESPSITQQIMNRAVIRSNEDD